MEYLITITWEGGSTMKRNPEERAYILEVLHDALKQAAETGLLDEIDKELQPLPRKGVFAFVNKVNNLMTEKRQAESRQPELQNVVIKV